MDEVQFDDASLAARLDALTQEELHALPFGVIKLDAEERVVFFSRTEAEQSGALRAQFVGLHFFESVAPCMNTPEVRGRVLADRERGALDLEVGHTGDYDDPTRCFRIRAMTAGDGGIWLAHQR